MFIRIETITLVVSKATGIPVSSILSKSRTRELCYARAFIVNIARKYGHTYKALAKEMNRDHSTLVKNMESLSNDLMTNPAIKHQLNQCYTEIKHLESLVKYHTKDVLVALQTE